MSKIKIFQVERVPVTDLEAAGLTARLRILCIAPLDRSIAEADSVLKESDDLWERGFLTLDQRNAINERVANQRNSLYTDKTEIERFIRALQLVDEDRSKIPPFLMINRPTPEEYTGEILELLNKAVANAYREYLKNDDYRVTGY